MPFANDAETRSRFSEIYGELQLSVVINPDGTVRFDEDTLEAGLVEEVRIARQDLACETPLADRRLAIRQEIISEFWEENPALFGILQDVAPGS